jgi:hypothetical protein
VKEACFLHLTVEADTSAYDLTDFEYHSDPPSGWSAPSRRKRQQG